MTAHEGIFPENDLIPISPPSALSQHFEDPTSQTGTIIQKN